MLRLSKQGAEVFMKDLPCSFVNGCIVMVNLSNHAMGIFCYNESFSIASAIELTKAMCRPLLLS